MLQWNDFIVIAFAARKPSDEPVRLAILFHARL
jgi:hypothetical protein